MPLMKRVESQIFAVEGFRVAMRYRDGRDIRGDRENIPGYPYDRMAKNSMTVGAWRKTRFHPHYVGFEVAVLDRRRNPVLGNTRLATVRDTYLDD